LSPVGIIGREIRLIKGLEWNLSEVKDCGMSQHGRFLKIWKGDALDGLSEQVASIGYRTPAIGVLLERRFRTLPITSQETFPHSRSKKMDYTLI
jgi:hypothetical protein